MHRLGNTTSFGLFPSVHAKFISGIWLKKWWTWPKLLEKRKQSEEAKHWHFLIQPHIRTDPSTLPGTGWENITIAQLYPTTTFFHQFKTQHNKWDNLLCPWVFRKWYPLSIFLSVALSVRFGRSSTHKQFQISQNGAFGKLLPEWSFSETLFGVLTCWQRKQSFWLTSVHHYLLCLQEAFLCIAKEVLLTLLAGHKCTVTPPLLLRSQGVSLHHRGHC